MSMESISRNTSSETSLGTSRIDSLDGLRGIASVIVLLYHTCKMLQLFGPEGLYEAIPGVSAVIVFFVISGVVLTLAPMKKLSEGKQYNWLGYYPRRVIRLCVPLVAAIALGVLASFVATATGLDPRQDKPIDWSIGLAEIARQVLMQFDVLFNATDGQYFIDGTRFVRANSPTWSMSWELWFSLALPLAVYVVWRTKRTWVGIAGCIVLAFLSSFTGYFPIRMCIMFIVGAYLAKVLPVLQKRNLWWGLMLLALVASLAAIEFQGFCASRGIFPIDASLVQTLSDIGCMMIVILAAMSGFVNRFLSSRPMRFLGKLSYSLYLTHVLVVGSIGPILPRVGVSSPVAIAAIIIVISFLVAWAFWRVVEKPSMEWSRKVGKEAMRS